MADQEGATESSQGPQPPDTRWISVAGWSLLAVALLSGIFLEILKGDEQAHNQKGNVYYGQHKLDEAIAEYQRAIELDPRFAAPHNSLGVVYYDQHKPDEAIAEYRKAIESSTKRVQCHTVTWAKSPATSTS